MLQSFFAKFSRRHRRRGRAAVRASSRECLQWDSTCWMGQHRRTQEPTAAVTTCARPAQAALNPGMVGEDAYEVPGGGTLGN